MTVKEYVTDVIQTLDERDLQAVADYLAFLRFRARTHAVPRLDNSTLDLYSEFGEEDRVMAEQGMEDYAAGLLTEDAK